MVKQTVRGGNNVLEYLMALSYILEQTQKNKENSQCRQTVQVSPATMMQSVKSFPIHYAK